MRFAFYVGQSAPFDALSLNDSPLGGTETGVIRLSEHLQKLGHECVVFVSQPKPRSSSVHYAPLAAAENSGPWDAFVSVRDWIPCFLNLEAKKRFFWTGDSYDQFPNYGLGDRRVSSRIDLFLTVSAWQASEICRRSGFPAEKTFILKNGIETELFDQALAKAPERTPKRLIYSSTPYRGLEHLLRYFPLLQKLHPDLELHLFTGYGVYGRSDDTALEQMKGAFLKLPSVFWHGNKKQAELVEEFLKSSILAYPCQFEETSCITALEAMAAGCVPVTSALAALPETIGECGILIEGRPGQKTYDETFLKSVHELLSHKDLWTKLSTLGKERARQQSWRQVAERFVDLLQKKV